MKTTVKNSKKHAKKVIELLKSGQSIVIVKDGDNESWSNGWVDYLMENYNYSNLNSGMRVNLEKPKKSKFTHKIQFGKVVYDAIKRLGNNDAYDVFIGKSNQGYIVDKGAENGFWKRYHGVSDLSEQVKPYSQVIVIPFES